MPRPKRDDASKTAADATKTATDTAKANASEWMTKLQDAIKDKKLDDAKTYLDKLEAIKSSLPAGFADEAGFAEGFV